MYMILVIIGYTKYNWKRYFPEKKILIIRYVSREKEHVPQKIVEGFGGMRNF